MAAVILSGSGRGAGKTAVGCALISAIPEYSWIAVKMSPHVHGLSSGLSEERESNSPKDTGRYLRAGAIGAFFISAPQPSSVEQPDHLRQVAQQAAEATAWMVESGRVDEGVLAQVAGPVVQLAILAGSVETWKPSLSSRLASMDAFVLTGGLLPERFPQRLPSKPIFHLPEGVWVSQDLVAFVRKSLSS
jgi:hypothetical protein